LTDNYIVLASGSPYRRALLERFGLAFTAWSPDIDEHALAGEKPQATAVRLARAKAEAARSRFPRALIIGSDQIADLDGEAIGKPGSRDAARSQLRRLSGKTVLFHTALCLLEAASARRHERVVTTPVVYRALADRDIDRYLARENALDCAGSAKIEGLGVALVARVGGDDPTALVGLPLIALGELLRAEGIAVP
jgi:septum formation protein